MTREIAIKVFRQLLDAFDNCEHGDYFYDFGDMVCEAANVAIAALREQEERSKACPYCDIAKANDGVRNTVLWVKEPETNKWTMMGKKLLFCPMCGRRLEDT